MVQRRIRRWKHREALHREIQAWLLTEEPRALVERLAGRGGAASLCNRMDEVLSNPHLRGRKAFREVTSGQLGKVTIAALPWSIEGEEESFPVAPGAAMGESNVAVYCDLLGLSEREYQTLRSKGALD